MDEIVPSTNKSYCEALNTGGKSPNQIQASDPSIWGPSYQRAAHPPNCPTMSWQPAYGVTSGPGLVQLNTTTDSSEPLFFCQNSQPVWSAWRDPSFGHAILDIKSDWVLDFAWYRNVDGIAQVADSVSLERLVGCANRKAEPMKA